MTSMLIRSLFLSACIATPIFAQQAPDTVRIDTVVVSATRLPLSRGALPVATTIISGDDLRSRGIASVSEALREVSSAYVAQAGSQGATTALFLRGGESKYVKVLIDGVPANEAGGTFDFASLTTDNVERIEIVRGPASVVHGADAVTGVVQIFTRRGRGPSRTEVDLRTGGAARTVSAGSEATHLMTLDATVTALGDLGQGAYSVALARHQSSGLYDFNNRYQNNVLSTRLNLVPGSATDIRLALRYNDYSYQYPTNSGGAIVDTNAYRTEDRMVIGGEVEQRLTETMRGVLAVNVAMNDGGTDDQMDPGAASPTSFVSQDKTRRRSAELRLHLLPSPATAAAGVTIGFGMEQQDQRSQSQSQSSFGPFNSVFRAARRNWSGYSEIVMAPTPQATLTLGGRVDRNEQFGTFGTGRGGFSWRPAPATRVRATFGSAFREPSFFENYSTGFVSGNPELRPERATSWDAGIEQELPRDASVSLAYFDQRFTNMIDYEPTATACGFSYCNVAAATARGVEVEARAHLYGAFAAGVGATFLKTEVVEPGYDATSAGLYRRGESLIRRPERNLSADLSWRGAGPLTATVRLLAMGVRQDKDFRSFPAEPVALPSYERVDFSAQYALSTPTTLQLRIENLTNVHYENVFNFRTPRRTIMLGARTVF
ncbi:MAG TPA: TonB-dependent receptor [Gemmatimonadaceae bacterium]|nr:TonB-dependent receptor [Gemmatimonadaceae bacterium]